MPIVHVEGPPITDLDTKRRFVTELTEAATRAYGLPKEIIVVLIKQNAPDNVGVGGQLLIDRRRAHDT